jgi:tellurite resistance protein TehA-like permease
MNVYEILSIVSIALWALFLCAIILGIVFAKEEKKSESKPSANPEIAKLYKTITGV